MDEQDDKSEICRLAQRLEDVAALYEQAATKVEGQETAFSLEEQAVHRREMSESFQAQVGIGGEASASTLPTPDSLLLKVGSALLVSDEAIVSIVRSADRELLAAVGDYLDHSQPSGEAKAAAEWLHGQLRSEIGPPVKEGAIPSIQPG